MTFICSSLSSSSSTTPFFAGCSINKLSNLSIVDGILLALAFQMPWTMLDVTFTRPTHYRRTLFLIWIQSHLLHGLCGWLVWYGVYTEPFWKFNIFLFWWQNRQMAHFSPFPCACLTLGGMSCDNPFIYQIFFFFLFFPHIIKSRQVGNVRNLLAVTSYSCTHLGKCTILRTWALKTRNFSWLWQKYDQERIYIPKCLMLVMVHKHKTCPRPIPFLTSSPFREEKCKSAQTRLIYEWFLLDSRHQSKRKKNYNNEERNRFENLKKEKYIFWVSCSLCIHNMPIWLHKYIMF